MSSEESYHNWFIYIWSKYYDMLHSNYGLIPDAQTTKFQNRAACRLSLRQPEDSDIHLFRQQAWENTPRDCMNRC